MEREIKKYIADFIREHGEFDGVGKMVYAGETRISEKWEILNAVQLPKGLFATIVPSGKDDEQYMIPVEDIFKTAEEFDRFFR